MWPTVPNALLKRSPFYRREKIILKNVRARKDTKDGLIPNKFYCPKLADVMLDKYVPYAPLWTNLMGSFVDKTRTSVANSPAEGYFNLVKNVNLDGGANIRATEYVRKSLTYVRAKQAEIDEAFLKGKIIPKQTVKNNIELEEDVWKRTPKKKKVIFNKKLCCTVMTQNFINLPRNIKRKRRFVVLKFQNVHEKLGNNFPLISELDVVEFKSIEGREELYNSIVDTFISITILSMVPPRAHATTCEEGYNFFYGSEETTIPINSHEQIFIQILHCSHFTLVYLNVNTKEFSYLNPAPSIANEGDTIFKTFQQKIQDSSWTRLVIEHPHQKDNFNCGVFISYFVESIVNKTQMASLDPKQFRNHIRNVLIENADDMQQICLHCGASLQPENICTSCKRPICSGCLEYYYTEPQIKPFQCELCRHSKN